MAPPKEDGKKATIQFSEPVTSVSKSDELRAHLQKKSLKGDTEEPVPISFEDICAAAFRICKGVSKTPCEKASISNSDVADMEIFFKKEYLHPTGSFKERGALNTLLLLSEEQKRQGVIAASAGNHAQALAYHGHALQIPVTVVMPENAPIVKQTMCRTYGANVVLQGHNLHESKEHALIMAREKGLVYINGYDHPHIISGQGTIGLEIIDQVYPLDAIIVPVGGGGMLAGIAKAVKTVYPHVKIIAVESERCPSFKAAKEAGKPVRVDAHHSETLADGLCVPQVGTNAFANSKDLVDKVITVRYSNSVTKERFSSCSEDFIGLAILYLIEMEKAVVEGAGATGLAAVLSGQLPELSGKRVVIPLCGGNIDPAVVGRCIDRGLATDGRLVRFIVTVSDRPGGIDRLVGVLASSGASIKDMFHERAWLKSSAFKVQCKVVAEVRDRDHANMLRTLLEKMYDDVHWNTDHATIYTNDPSYDGNV